VGRDNNGAHQTAAGVGSREAPSRKARPASSSQEGQSTLAGDEDISEKRRTDPRLRPFVVAMANAIIKDMLRERKEEAR
jgi:hypothetical protein